jgi:NCS1 family nucleobase:cation symporter-1
MHGYGAGTNPVGDFTGFLPHWFSYFVLYGIALGSICANVLNIYSGAISFDAIGLRLRGHWLRAFTALVFGVIGFFIAHWAMNNPANNLENFLLVMSYWIGPWLGVMAADKLLRRGRSIQGLLYADRENPAGVVAFVISAVLAIWLFANQTYYTGYFPKHNPKLGDVAFAAGFIIAFFLYTVLRPLMGNRTAED